MRDGVGIARPNGSTFKALGEAFSVRKREIRGRTIGNGFVKAY